MRKGYATELTTVDFELLMGKIFQYPMTQCFSAIDKQLPKYPHKVNRIVYKYCGKNDVVEVNGMMSRNTGI